MGNVLRFCLYTEDPILLVLCIYLYHDFSVHILLRFLILGRQKGTGGNLQ